MGLARSIRAKPILLRLGTNLKVRSSSQSAVTLQERGGFFVLRLNPFKSSLSNNMDESKGALRIFVLADTHNRLPESVREMAKDADEIWHLGDVCSEAILDELRAIGPAVIVVRGNCDSNFEWPLVRDLARGGLKFRLQHVPPDHPPDDVDVLLHGHTHVPRNERLGRVLFLNPGCVTRPNRGAPASVALLEIVDGKISWKLVPFLRHR